MAFTWSNDCPASYLWEGDAIRGYVVEVEESGKSFGYMYVAGRCEWVCEAASVDECKTTLETHLNAKGV
jgi:hypothetical protein